jgi:hypothetical protein
MYWGFPEVNTSGYASAVSEPTASIRRQKSTVSTSRRAFCRPLAVANDAGPVRHRNSFDGRSRSYRFSGGRAIATGSERRYRERHNDTQPPTGCGCGSRDVVGGKTSESVPNYGERVDTGNSRSDPVERCSARAPQCREPLWKYSWPDGQTGLRLPGATRPRFDQYHDAGGRGIAAYLGANSPLAVFHARSGTHELAWEPRSVPLGVPESRLCLRWLGNRVNRNLDVFATIRDIALPALAAASSHTNRSVRRWHMIFGVVRRPLGAVERGAIQRHASVAYRNSPSLCCRAADTASRRARHSAQGRCVRGRVGASHVPDRISNAKRFH